MRNFYSFAFVFFSIYFCSAQNGFKFTNDKSKVVIPVQIENNLIIIPVEINNVPMRFLLDTGVEETILFSLEDKNELELFNVEKIRLRGLGDQESVEGLKSIGNTLRLKGLESKNEALIVVLDESFNFSASLGVEVNGIIGYKIFKDKCVALDYENKQVIVYESIKLIKKIRKYSIIPISIEENKPYLSANVNITNQTKAVKMLVDSGSSDAVWIFRSIDNKIIIPEKNFDDFLGRGLSGDILGKRAEIWKLSIGNFEFKNPLAAFPDTLSLKKMNLVEGRSGSIGAEICSRFKVIFDYRNGNMYLKKNQKFDKVFQYNKSGLEIQHAGVRIIKEEQMNNISNINGGVRLNFGDNDQNVKFNFALKPNFEIVNIRKASPSDNAGLQKGDLILAINGIASYRYKLHEINNILKSEEGTTIKLEIDRKGSIMKISFKLKELF